MPPPEASADSEVVVQLKTVPPGVRIFAVGTVVFEVTTTEAVLVQPAVVVAVTI